MTRLVEAAIGASLFTGEQYEIASGAHRAVIVEVGAGLRSYTLDGRDVVDGYGIDEMCSSGRGQLLAPWPNRVEDGTYEFEATPHRLSLTEPEAHNAIHGLVRWAAWDVREHERSRVLLAHQSWPRPGYPFTLDLHVEYVLSEGGLTVSTRATNVGRQRAPYGCGQHPYLTLDQAVDTLELSVPATTVLVADERGIPVSASGVEGSGYDFRRRRAIGDTVLDHCFTELARDADGVARVELASDDHTSVLWMDRTYGYVMLYSGDARPDVARRALAVEPMTCPPNAFRSGTSVIVLEPGATVTSSWGIAPS